MKNRNECKKAVERERLNNQGKKTKVTNPMPASGPGPPLRPPLLQTGTKTVKRGNTGY